MSDDRGPRFDPATYLSVLAGAVVGAPFCGAAAKAALDGNIGSAILGFLFGGLVLAAGGIYPVVRGRLSNALRKGAAIAAFVAVGTVVLAAFIYTVGPILYNHVVGASGRQYISSGIIDDDFEGRPLGVYWEGSYLNVLRETTGDGTFLLTISVYTINGKSLGSNEISIRDAYVISSVDSTKIPLTIFAIPGGMIDIGDASPIPPGAAFSMQANFARGDARLSEADFLKTWNGFYIVIESDEQKIRHLISRTKIHNMLEVNHPELSPHVTKKR
jgi:hypothetical protein